VVSTSTRGTAMTRSANYPTLEASSATDSTNVNVSASSVGLVAVRVANAAARKRIVGELNERDRIAIRAVITDLHDEAEILRGAQEANADDEGSYAFAGFALSAISDLSDESTSDGLAAAARLDALVRDLEQLLENEDDPAALQRIESIFIRASRIASRGLSSSGERLDGIPANFRLR
jgi:hypothetical protein